MGGGSKVKEESIKKSGVGGGSKVKGGEHQKGCGGGREQGKVGGRGKRKSKRGEGGTKGRN